MTFSSFLNCFSRDSKDFNLSEMSDSKTKSSKMGGKEGIKDQEKKEREAAAAELRRIISAEGDSLLDLEGLQSELESLVGYRGGNPAKDAMAAFSLATEGNFQALLVHEVLGLMGSLPMRAVKAALSEGPINQRILKTVNQQAFTGFKYLISLLKKDKAYPSLTGWCFTHNTLRATVFSCHLFTGLIKGTTDCPHLNSIAGIEL